MVGSAIKRQLEFREDIDLILRDRKNLISLILMPSLNFLKMSILTKYIWQQQSWQEGNNTYPASFIYENLAVQNNIINTAHKNGVNKVLFF